MQKQKVITILGPTASGKSALGVYLAKKMGSSIISGDAFQVYQGMDIGTAKVSRSEMEGVLHYLVDCFHPTESYSAAIFAEKASHYIEIENNSGRIPFIVGGTGLYIEGLLAGFEFRDKGSTRQHWMDLYEKEGIAGLIAAAKNIPAIKEIPQDKQRLIRSLELATDNKSQQAGRAADLVYKGPVIGISMDREKLYERINLRVEHMFEQGLEQEVRALLASGIPADAQAFKGIGYKEMLAYIRGELSLHGAKELIKKNTRHFAKRQLTWFRHMPYIQWIERSDTENNSWYEQAEQLIYTYYSM